jgi:hypothetical protein
MIGRLAKFRGSVWIGALTWIGLVGLGFVVLGRYQATPGPVGQTPSSWPHDTQIHLAPGRDTLLMFAHPRCPCTRASMEELAQIMTRCQGRLEARVLFYTPPGASESWAQSSIWTWASAIPGVQVCADPGGREAARMGAECSGHVLLFDPAGRLLFSGGITGARGEGGDNLGRQAIVALVTGRSTERSRTLVFGCPILDRRTP